jgi:hypothetical protein
MYWGSIRLRLLAVAVTLVVVIDDFVRRLPSNS